MKWLSKKKEHVNLLCLFLVIIMFNKNCFVSVHFVPVVQRDSVHCQVFVKASLLQHCLELVGECYTLIGQLSETVGLLFTLTFTFVVLVLQQPCNFLNFKGFFWYMHSVCVCVCVRACMRACVRAYVCTYALKPNFMSYVSVEVETLSTIFVAFPVP